MRALGASLGVVSGRYQERRSHMDALRRELSKELRWVEEALGSFPPPSSSSSSPSSPGGDGGGGGGGPNVSFSAVLFSNNEVNEALKELLNRSCGGELLSSGIDLDLSDAGQQR